MQQKTHALSYKFDFEKSVLTVREVTQEYNPDEPKRIVTDADTRTFDLSSGKADGSDSPAVKVLKEDLLASFKQFINYNSSDKTEESLNSEQPDA
jgi:hypothetical protein